ncbi:hypothetical protein CDAR_35771 [Caerostris darwini]|uniref:Secreted protein n=1 Tax=Caerostris darwini TaxID=1538125 RepID=A0AAV4VBQ9_9ARAC|nr:hypothetical protein CDAR_35771 [Caerostris darwini]
MAGNLISRCLLVVCWGRACLLPFPPPLYPAHFFCATVAPGPPQRERGAHSPPPLTDAPAALISVLGIWQRSFVRPNDQWIFLSFLRVLFFSSAEFPFVEQRTLCTCPTPPGRTE